MVVARETVSGKQNNGCIDDLYRSYGPLSTSFTKERTRRAGMTRRRAAVGGNGVDSMKAVLKNYQRGVNRMSSSRSCSGDSRRQARIRAFNLICPQLELQHPYTRRNALQRFFR